MNALLPGPSTALLPALLAIAAYGATFALQWRALRSPAVGAQPLVWACACVAALAHGIAVWQQIDAPAGYNFGLFTVASVVNWLTFTLLLLFSFRLPIANLLLLVAPLAVLAILASLLFSSRWTPVPGLNAQHIIPSLLAYSVLFIAACQAVLLAVQERRLRTSRSLFGLRLLPPLQVMEHLLFQLIWAGLLLLTIAIGTGFLFLDNLFEQHVVHHAVLSMSSWLVFAVLLWGRYTLGWRGSTAIRWTLAGFGTLALAYFGSKVVLELLLQR